MSERKQTPDVLADILSGPAPAPDLGASLPVGRITDLPQRRPAARAPRAKPGAADSAEQPAPTPPTWEYETVSFQEAHGWRPRFINGRELRNWMHGPLLHDYVNQRSTEGWELAAVASGQSMYGTSDRYQIYFRRPKQGQ
jgi:hypothetical protein